MLCRAAEVSGGGGGNGHGAGKPVASGGSGEPLKPNGSSNALWAWYMSCLDANPVSVQQYAHGDLELSSLHLAPCHAVGDQGANVRITQRSR